MDVAEAARPMRAAGEDFPKSLYAAVPAAAIEVAARPAIFQAVRR